MCAKNYPTNFHLISLDTYAYAYVAIMILKMALKRENYANAERNQSANTQINKNRSFFSIGEYVPTRVEWKKIQISGFDTRKDPTAGKTN